MSKYSNIVGKHDDYGFVYCVAFSPDGKKIVSGGSDYTVRLWDLTRSAHGNELTSRTSIATSKHNCTIWSVAFSPDGKKIVYGGGDCTVRLWDLTRDDELYCNKTGQIIGIHENYVFSVAFSPDGKKIASGSGDNTIILWDLQNNNNHSANPHYSNSKIIGRHEYFVRSVAFSPDGKKIASTGWDETIRLWDNLTGMTVASNVDSHIIARQDDSIWSVAFSPNGKKIVSGGHDGIIRLWDLTSTRKERRYKDEFTHSSQIIGKHDDLVHSTVFSTDGKKIASGSGDGTIRLWDLSIGMSEVLGKHDGSAYCVAFSPDDKTIASGGENATVKLWINPFWIRDQKKRLI